MPDKVTTVETSARTQLIAVGETETEVRQDLAACYRLMALFGMTDLASNHITAKVPGASGHFFINPYGMLYEEVTASSLNKVDFAGAIVAQGNTACGVNTAGYVIHSAIHAARSDASCVIHTHTRAGVGVSCLEDGLLPLNQTALQLSDDIAYHAFEGPATSLEERARLSDDLGRKNILILRNHGLITCGRSIPEAFVLMYLLNCACEIQMDVLASGATIHHPSAMAIAAQAEVMTHLRKVPRNFEWAALRRKLDRVLPGYEG
jgi:ribulose-5-phosphate 4-epimerase/fuculose-1-phosphate aldolase